ncbi:glycoside hydrolase family 5 protein [Stieleria sp. TO1_6]|uniref:cellulase family glycosylhydrolase n=1 Tax=Stieleria tagensis TaxID=2956795 RepID=UPI00209B99FD|nr:cellulase family glycosylhydrolase [Stieleria tagensis]MCO8120620.1 glycoside hydrolase family 5 protein [Stieleria tagensis]
MNVLNFALALAFLSLASIGSTLEAVEPLPMIRVSDDGKGFVQSESGQRFIVWGVNYDHDSDGRLLDEYWIEEWDTVVQDFDEMKQLGVNVVRVHLQFGKFMIKADKPNPLALGQLAKLVELAEEKRLYLDITGLACYHKQNIPDWYVALDESQRWRTQSVFWQAVAKVCAGSPAVFCYDLMNEPVLPGKEVETEWLGGELGGKFFVQRLSLDAKGRDRQQIAAAWVRQMTDAIRRVDADHMITVGVIPWVFAFGGGKPLFYSPEVGEPLDFVAVHFYPEKGKIDAAVEALKKYEVGKPLVIEEMFPLKSGVEGMREFVIRSASHADGWISFYWGTPAAELKQKPNATFSDAFVATWLEMFQTMAEDAKSGTLAD